MAAGNLAKSYPPNGRRKHPLYYKWLHMNERCANPNNKSWHLYGGRGIGVCDRWRFGDGEQSGFDCFLSDMGDRPAGMELDRIDNNGHYHPANRRWASRKQQANNHRRNVVIESRGKSQTVAQWCDELGLPYWRVIKRVARHGATPAALEA